MAALMGKTIGVDFTWRQLGMLALSAGVVSLVGFLMKSPLPGLPGENSVLGSTVNSVSKPQWKDPNS
jgi:hypothetical protein